MIRTAIAIVAGLALTACGSDATGDDAVTIVMTPERGFTPAAVTVPVGTTVVFENDGTVLRSVSSARVGSPPIPAEDFWAVRLQQPGVHRFVLEGDVHHGAEHVAIVEVE